MALGGPGTAVRCFFTLYAEGLAKGRVETKIDYGICTDIADPTRRYFLPHEADFEDFEPNDTLELILVPTTTLKPITEAAGVFWSVAEVLMRTEMGPNPIPPPAFDGQGPTTDMRSMLAVLMKYQDEPGAVAGCKQDEFEKKAFTNDDSWAELIYKGSHHVTKFPQEQYQWVEVTVPGSVPRDKNTCSVLTMMIQEFADGATSRGYDPRQFHNVMYLTPPGWCDKTSYAQAQVLCPNTIAGGRHNVGTACMSWYYQSSDVNSNH